MERRVEIVGVPGGLCAVSCGFVGLVSSCELKYLCLCGSVWVHECVLTSVRARVRARVQACVYVGRCVGVFASWCVGGQTELYFGMSVCSCVGGKRGVAPQAATPRSGGATCQAPVFPSSKREPCSGEFLVC